MKIGPIFVAMALTVIPAAAQQRGSPPTTASPAKSVPAVAADSSDAGLGSKVILYGEKDVVRLRTKQRYTTLIILPKTEKVLDFSCGDKEFWVVEGSENFAYVKPAKANAQTNLNLITASGNIYSFSLVEVSGTPDVEPDLKVFVELKDESMINAAKGPERFVSVNEIEKVRKEADDAKEETRRVRQITDETIDRGVNKILSKVRCGYQFKKNQKPFYVSTICHDDKFTYLSMAPEETPSIYDVRDGPNLVNFSYQPLSMAARPNSGILTVQKIIQRGYIAIGKERLYFSIKE